MKTIEFSQAERAEIVRHIQRYFETELDGDIGALPAEMLLRFFAERIGAFYYNRGLRDAQAVIADKLDEINDAIYGLEQRDARAR